MGTNNKHSPPSERNGSPSNKQKHSSGTQQQQQQFQRPSPSKSINIKTPSKNPNVAGVVYNNNNKQRLSGSCSPPNFSFFAGSKCFESPSPQSLPKPPTAWFSEGGEKKNAGGESYRTSGGKSRRARKSLNLSIGNANTSCAAEFAKQQNNTSFALISNNSNDHYTQNLKLLLNVSA